MGLIPLPPNPAPLLSLHGSAGKKPQVYHRTGHGASYTFTPRLGTTQTPVGVTLFHFLPLHKRCNLIQAVKQKLTEILCAQQHPEGCKYSCSSELEPFTAAASSQGP